MNLVTHMNQNLPRLSTGAPVPSLAQRALAVAGLVVSAPSALLLSPLLSVRSKRLVDGLGRVFHYRSFIARSTAGGLLARAGLAHLFWPSLAVARGHMAWVGGTASGAWLPAHGLPAGVVTPVRLRERTGINFTDAAALEADYARRRTPWRDALMALRYALVSAVSGRSDGTPSDWLRVGPVFVDNLTQGQAVDRIMARLQAPAHLPPMQVSFVNAHCVNVAARDAAYRNALLEADLALADGIGLRLAGSLLGKPLRDNVNGTDLIEPLCAELARSGHRVFFLGGQPGVADAAAAALLERHPGLQLAGCYHGFFGMQDLDGVLRRVRASGADLLVVAMGVPLQDQFLARYLDKTGARVGMGVGGLFDFLSHRIPRAPHWLRELGLEWTWRFAQEPGRMWRRYLVGNFSFMARIVRQRLARQQ